MNKYVFACAIALPLFAAHVALADIVPPNSHPLEHCFQIVNTSAFPNITLFSKITGPMIHDDDDTPTTPGILEGVCLTKGYKFNSLSIYWAKKGDAPVADTAHLLLANAPVYGGFVSDDDPRIKVTLEYSIAGMKDGKPVLYESKEITSTKGIVPPKTVTFANPLGTNNGPAPTPKPTPTPAPTPAPKPTPVPQPTSTPANPSVTPVPAQIPAPILQRSLWEKVVCFFEGLLGDPCPAQ